MLTLLLLISLFPGAALARDVEEHVYEDGYVDIVPFDVVHVSTQMGLISAVFATPTNGALREIILTADISGSGLGHITPGRNIILNGNGHSFTVTRTRHFSVNNSTVRLRNIILDNTAEGDSGGIEIMGGGHLIMEAGSAIRGGTAGDGAGVFLSANNENRFTMYNGEISGNTSRLSGGGVRLLGGTFIMHDGIISGNTANANGGGISVGARILLRAQPF